jgi:hypothetical protein
MPKRGRERKTTADRWRRRTGVIYRPATIWSESMPKRFRRYSIDGGDDAPLTRTGRTVFRCTFAFVIVAGVGLIMWARP